MCDCADWFVFICLLPQYQQLKQQQLMKHHRQLVHQSRGVIVNGNKNVGPVDLSSSAWSNQLPRREVMRAVFIGDRTGKRGSTGTGVFLPRSVNHTSRTETREKPSKFRKSSIPKCQFLVSNFCLVL